jgi:hypothetical protein
LKICKIVIFLTKYSSKPLLNEILKKEKHCAESVIHEHVPLISGAAVAFGK